MAESHLACGSGRSDPHAALAPAAILFDLDGTLVDTVVDIAHAANAVLAEVGASRLPVDVVRGYVGDGARELMARCLAHDEGARSGAGERSEAFCGRDVDAATRRFRAVYEADPCREARPYPGVVEGVRRLGEHARLAVVTNKPLEIATALLDALELAPAFELVVGEGGAGRSKPDPAPLEFALGALGSRASRTWMVGDGVQDVRAGRAAGVRVAAALWGLVAADELRALAPDRAAPDFGQLVEALIRADANGEPSSMGGRAQPL